MSQKEDVSQKEDMSQKEDVPQIYLDQLRPSNYFEKHTSQETISTLSALRKADFSKPVYYKPEDKGNTAYRSKTPTAGPIQNKNNGGSMIGNKKSIETNSSEAQINPKETTIEEDFESKSDLEGEKTDIQKDLEENDESKKIRKSPFPYFWRKSDE